MYKTVLHNYGKRAIACGASITLALSAFGICGSPRIALAEDSQTPHVITVDKDKVSDKGTVSFDVSQLNQYTKYPIMEYGVDFDGDYAKASEISRKPTVEFEPGKEYDVTCYTFSADHLDDMDMKPFEVIGKVTAPKGSGIVYVPESWHTLPDTAAARIPSRFPR